MKMMRKPISCILILVTMLTLSVPIFAAQPVAASPQYTDINNAYVTLFIDSSGYARIQLVINGTSTFKSATITTHIEKKEGNCWVTVGDYWYDSASLSTTKTHYRQLTGSGEYRACAVFVITGSTTETIRSTSRNSY